MRIEIGRTKATIKDADDKIIGEIEQLFTYKVQGASYIKKNHKSVHPIPHPSCYMCMWDGTTCLVDKKRLSPSIPIGLVGELIEFLDKKNTKYEIIEYGSRPQKAFNWQYNFKLRRYQKECLDVLLSNRMGIVWAPTGSGKTKIIVALVAELGLPAVVVVPRKSIFVQTIKEFQNTNIDIGGIGAGDWEDALVNVVMPQTINKNKEKASKLLSQKEVLILDEVHFSAANTWQELVKLCPAYYRYGFSATPYRADDLEQAKLRSVCGKVIFKLELEELQEMGFVAQTEIKIISIPCSYKFYTEDEFGQRKTTFAEKYREGIVYNKIRNNIIRNIIEKYVNKGKKVLCIVSWLEHAEEIKENLNCNYILMSGKDTKKKVEEKINQFISYPNGIACIGTSVLDCGIDLPPTNVLILAGGGKYSGRTKQQLGRGLRIAPNKQKLLCFDFFDDDSAYKSAYFMKHSISRLQTYSELDQEFSITSYKDFLK